jgi:MFS family permease
MQQMQSKKVGYGRLLRNRSFVALWVGQTVSFVGDYFQWLAIPIMVERLTGSALMVGLSVISNALPMLLLGPVAGVFVDRWDRKRTMIVADLLRGFLVLLCLLVQRPEQVWIYYVVGFLMSCVSRFFFPAQNAVLPLIVPDKSGRTLGRPRPGGLFYQPLGGAGGICGRFGNLPGFGSRDRAHDHTTYHPEAPSDR